MRFNSPSLGPLSLPEVIARIREFADASDRHEHRVIIGTDSVSTANQGAELVTAIVVHRVGNGGIYFWRRVHKDKIHTLRDRMYQEAMASIDLARTMVDEGLLIPHLTSADVLEIHIDIGENGPTREMIREIVGMVTGYGFRVKTKPEAYGANKVADRHT